MRVGDPTRRAILAGLSRQAIAFDTKEQMEKYLEEHPDADSKNHSVKTKKTNILNAISGIVDRMKGANKELKDIVKAAPEKTQKMLFDSDERKKAFGKVSEVIKTSAKKLSTTIYDSAKSEVKEIGHATKAAKKLFKKPPGPFSKEDKQSFYATSAYVAGAAIAAIPPGSAVAALGALAHSFKMHVAIKSVSHLLDKGFIHYEWTHSLSEGFSKLGGEDAESDESELGGALVRALTENVADVLENLDDSDIAEIMKGVEKPS